MIEEQIELKIRITNAAIEKLDKAIVAALRDATVSARLQDLGLKVIADKPEEFGAFIKAEAVKWGKLINEANIKLE